MQAKELVGNEAVDQRQWQAFHAEQGIQRTSTFVIVGTRQQSYLVAILHQAGLHGMGVVLFLQVDQLGAEVAQQVLLVGHVLHIHVADH